jgi:hypothetical protein
MAEFDRAELANALHGTFIQFMDTHGADRVPVNLALGGALAFVAGLIVGAMAEYGALAPERRQEWMASIHTTLDALVAGAVAMRVAEEDHR